MLQRSTIGALLLVLGLGSLALTQPEIPSSAHEIESDHIGELIRQLGSTRFQERSAAQKELESIGASALEQLKKSLPTADLETSKRAAELVRKIEEKIFTAVVLAPKRVHFNVTDMPAMDAMSTLAHLSGYSVQVLGDRARAGETKVTLHCDDTPFWEVLDQLCAQAALVEKIQTAAPTGRLNALQPGLPGNFLPILPMPAGPPPVQAQPRMIQLQIQGQLWPPFDGQSPRAQAGITLVPGPAHGQNFSYAGSVRSRVATDTGAKAGDYRLTLMASAEPRLQGFAIVGTPSVDNVLDDQGQQLLLRTESSHVNPVSAPGLAPGRLRGAVTVPALSVERQVALVFKVGEKPAKSFKTLCGSFTAQVMAPPEPLITMRNVLKSVGESVPGKSGGMLKLHSIDKLPGGDYRVQIYLQSPSGNNAMGGMKVVNARIQVGGFGLPDSFGNANGLPELLDTNGKKFQTVQIPARRLTISNGALTQEITIIFRAGTDQGEPESLVLHGTRLVNISVPFSFQNVVLE